MGVWGMQHFISNSSGSFLKPYKLQNTYLVLDGENMKYRLYFDVFSLKYGGDYDVYYEKLKSVLLNFQKCGLTLIVLWDGVSLEEKNRVRFFRWLAKVRSLEDVENEGNRILIPMFTGKVFQDVLTELKIMQVTTLSESDKDAAIIANLLNCPILSDDSDFCMFDVQYIPFKKMSFEVKTDQTAEPGRKHYFDCILFDRTAFWKEYKLNQELFLLLPVLFGEDDHQRNLVKGFFYSLDRRSFKNCKTRLQKVLMWFQEVGSFDSALAEILAGMEDSARKELLKIIERVTEYYTLDDKALSPYIKINKNESKIYIDKNIELEMLPKDHVLSQFPKVVVKNFIKNKIKAVFVKLPSEYVIYSIIQMEDKDECNTSSIALPIFSSGLQILNRIMGQDYVKTIYLRNKLNPVRVLMYNSKNFLNGITRDILTAEVQKRRKLFFEVVGFDKKEIRIVQEIGQSWSVFIVSIVYWMKNRSHHMRREKVELAKPGALLMAAMGNHAESIIKDSERNESSTDANARCISRRLAKVPRSELSDFAKNLAQVVAADIKYSVSTIHNFALFQSCLNAVLSLNDILDNPLPDIMIHEFYSGRKAHNINECMKDPLFVEHVLEETPNVRMLYHYLINKIKLVCPNETIV